MPTGLFSYNSQWIPKNSAQIKLITTYKPVPLSQQAFKATKKINKTVEEAFVLANDNSIPFEVERDTSGVGCWLPPLASMEDLLLWAVNSRMPL